MNASKLKIFLTYATLGAGLASGLLLWSARQKMHLLSVPDDTQKSSITLEPLGKLKPSDTETKSELARTVQGQLDAIRANDYAKAFGFAVKGIQAGFSLKDFEAMVKRDYASIADWKSARFGVSLDNGLQGVLQVFVQGDGKVEEEFQYNLEKEDGTWKVAGVKGPIPITESPGGIL